MVKKYLNQDGKQITQFEYLYGEGAEVYTIPEDIIIRKIEALTDNLGELLEHSYYTRDGDRVNAVIKAIAFWENINKT